MKKILLVFLSLVMAGTVLALPSCAPTDPNPPAGDDTTTEPVTSEPVPDPFSFAADESVFIVYGSGENDETFANSLVSFMKVYGFKNVSAVKDTKSTETDKEILIGQTNRAQSTKMQAYVDEQLAEGDSGLYAKVIDGKLAVLFNDDLFLKDGVTEIMKKIKNGVFTMQGTDVVSFKTTAEEKAGGGADRVKELANLKQAQSNFSATEFGTHATLHNDYMTPTIYPLQNSHPRVLFNTTTVQTVKTNLTASENTAAYLGYINLSKKKTDGHLNERIEGSHYNYDVDILNIIEAYALRYAMEGDELYGYRAIVAIRNYLSDIFIETAPSNGATGYLNVSYRAWGNIMFTTAEVYDWCYDLMTAGDRQAIISAMCNKVAPKTEMGYPPSKQGCISGHGAEAQLLRNWLSFAIAAYDEAPDLYNYVMGRLQQEYVPAREYYYQSGMHSQGNTYGTYRFNFDLTAQWLVKVACNQTLIQADLMTVARSFIYNVRPDETLLRVGDDTNQRYAPYDMTSYSLMLFYSAALNQDSIAKGEAKKLLNNFSKFPSNDDQTLTSCQFLIFNDVDLECGSKDQLPLSVYCGSPVGQIISRNTWGSTGCMLYMKIGEMFAANHEHKDVGSFQIYYGGMLAIDSGFYDSYGSSSVVHFKYTASTLAHNSLLIYDPNEAVSSSFQNVGGQLSNSTESKTLDEWLEYSPTERAEELWHLMTENEGKTEYSFIAGDITKAYASSKVDEVIRYMEGYYTGNDDVPLIFFVFDKITADNANFKKTFLLHTMAEPTVTGNVTAVSYQGGTLVNQTLLPGTNNVDITVVSGPYTGVASEDAVTRYNDKNAASERGWGRVEICPKLGNKTDYLLNVMYVTKTNNQLATNYAVAVAYENDDLAGASVMNVAAFFSKDAKGLSSAFTIQGEGTDTVKYSVAGVCAGTWTVYNASKQPVAQVTVTEESGFLTFEAPAGTYEIAPAN